MQLQTLQEKKIKFDTVAVPFHLMRNAIQAVPYGSSTRVMFMICAITGCRIKEMEKMKLSLLYKHPTKVGYAILYWKTGKNQTGYRQAELPDYLLEELRHYRLHHRTYEDRLFAPDARSFRKYFNQYRGLMSHEWGEMWDLPEECGIVKREHVFGLCGLRKSWATLSFAKELKKWNSADIAMQMVSKRMKHSCKEMTSHHYIKNFDYLEIHKYVDMEISEILRQPLQTKIHDYLKIEERPLVIY